MSLVWENVASKINVAIQIPSILLNVLLIYLSLFCVPKSVLRKFTLNLAVVCLLCNLYKSAFVLMELFASQELLKDSIVVRFEDWKIVIGEIALNIYQFLTTTAILLAYLTFAKPLTYHNFSGRKVTMLFCAVDVLSVTISVSLYFIHEYTESEDPMLIHQIFCWVFFLCFLVSYVLMIYLYIMIAYQAMRRFKRHPEATQHSLNKQWTALASFFVFSTFPNLFLLIAIPDVMCETLLNAVPIEVREYTVFGHCEVAAYIADCLIVPRICICSICALFAFPDYRKAFISLVRRRIAKIASSRTLFVRSNSSIINVTS
ncbi:hypothetical protein L596_021300 [Steinernema carpocapsae]|uniref:G-protein coupled receptors family 1 profile domain-containing protein n=1 Tax=Steinernema carpocapsae TaxID=34508 RepID=A0A4U5MJ56_STECR|nr:hypothetical protein L596_021300 [Steinernema carpocapsae]